MKNVFAVLFCCAISAAPARAQSAALFDDTKIPSIFLEIHPDSLDFMVQEIVHTRYMKARFVFDDGQKRDTVAEVGLRLRGNTSLGSQKKSFKVSFNEFQPGQKYQGVKKLNLNGSHNDPSCIREKLFYDVWNKAGMPVRRVNFAKLFINGDYFGLYTNAEEIDKTWLKKTFGDNDANLWKCTYPADLAYLGDSQQPYKDLMNNPFSRAYDLVTNEAADNYWRLVQMISFLGFPTNAAYPVEISSILNVDGVLKAYAIDVATGNWDDYFYNKNNYFLYDDSLSGRFQFITYDTDNTYGIDWLGKDWTTRDALAWHKSSEARPLATKLLAVPAFKQKFVFYLDSISRFITAPDSIFPRIDQLHNLVTNAAVADQYRTLDYGYTVGDFHNSFTQTIDGHSPYGVKPFFTERGKNTKSQIAGILAASFLHENAGGVLHFYPNPTDGKAVLEGLSAKNGSAQVKVFNSTGVEMGVFLISSSGGLDVSRLPDGLYFVLMEKDGRGHWGKLIKSR